MRSSVYREITPLSADDCFTIFSRHKECFDFPLHVHDEFELNFITGGKGAKRVVGFHMGEIDDPELVLTGGGISHAWFTHHCQTKDIHEITIQFHKDLFDEKLLMRNQMAGIRMLLQRASQGILFSRVTAASVAPRLQQLIERKGFESVLELMSILYELAVKEDIQILSPVSVTYKIPDIKSRRLDKVFDFIRNNYDKEITLKQVAGMANMPEVSFSRFFKKRTGRTFIESLVDIRLGHASRLLITTTDTIAEISYKCGFNNMSYFNRVFKKKNQCTPGEFRENFTDSKVFI